MSETLSNIGTSKVDAEEQTNDLGILSTILSFQPIDGMEMVVQNSVGGKRGIPIYAELKDSNGNDLPLDTVVAIRWDAPHLDQPKIVSYKLDNIRQYRTLSIKEQQSEDYRERTRQELKGSSLTVEDNEEMQVAVKSSEEIDWSNSTLYVDENAVTVRSAN